MSGDGWVWPAYGFEQWAWDEMNGWYNPEDDPASPTETVLLDEIVRLRAALRLACVEVFGFCDPLATSPDELAESYINEARRG